MKALNDSGAKVWRFFGIPRSGNHAIIEWVMKNIDDGTLVFLNNCGRGSPSEAFSYTNFDRGNGVEKHRGNIYREKNRHYTRLAEAIEHAENIVVSYEIFPVDTASTQALWQDSKMTSDEVQDTFIIRSPLNLLASCLKRIENETTHKNRIAVKTRNFLADQFSQYSGYLKRYEDDPESCVIYDLWGADEKYRAEKLRHLGIDAVNTDLGQMTSAGGGSSFDRGQEISTISTSKRWIGLETNEFFNEAVNDMVTDQSLMQSIHTVFPKDHAQLVELGS